MIDTTQTWHYFGAFFVEIQVTRLTFETLMKQAVEKRATVVTKGRTRVAVQHELVFINWCVRVGTFVHTRTNKRDKLVASLVNGKRADLTLKALLAKAPNKVFAVGAKCGLLEEARHKLVLFYIVDILLAESSSSIELLILLTSLIHCCRRMV